MRGRQRFNYAIKVALTNGLYYTGLLRLWQRIALRKRAVVLMYHRVLTAEERARSGSHPALVVDRDTFARHMEVLKRSFVVLTVDELADRMERGQPLPDCSCLITFDDGWRDNFTNAFPVLKRLSLPALVFLPVNFIGSRRLFWQEALVHLLSAAIATVRAVPARRARLAAVLAPAELDDLLDVAAAEPRAAILSRIGSQKLVAADSVARLLTELSTELGVRLEDYAATDGFMDWSEVEAMAAAGVAFGGHGAEHRLLTYVSADEVEAEIGESKAVIDRRFVGTAPTFSYPNGYCNADVVDRVRQSGYRLAFTTRRGLVSAGDDRFTVCRYNIHEAVTATTPMFLARVTGLL
jgi:peptidoglycan/xylan/chitin deacetylase (PgdA/CDA1 family)